MTVPAARSPVSVILRQVANSDASVRLLRPELPPLPEVEAYFRESLEARWFSNGGPCHRRLVRRLVDRVPVGTHTVPVSNCTIGLMLALRALVPRGTSAQEVVLPSFTFAATATAVTWCGLSPVFADVEPEGWHLDPHSLSETLDRRGGRIAAVVACSTFGTAPPIEQRRAWERIAREADVPLLVDSAAGFGSVDAEGRPLGAQGDAEVFSWHATKPFAVGEGGLVCSRREEVAAAVRRLATFGFDDDRVVADEPGLNGKLDEWHAAVALAQLDRFDDVLKRRRARARIVTRELARVGFCAQRDAGGGTFQLVSLLAPTGAARDAARVSAAARGVETAAYFSVPLHRMPAFAEAPRTAMHVTDDLSSRMIGLPMANDLPSRALELVIDVVGSASALRRSIP